MTNEKLKALIAEGLSVESVEVHGDGRHFKAIIVSDEFESLSRLQRQQKVYGVLSDAFRDGDLHAITMHTYTANEWKAQHE